MCTAPCAVRTVKKDVRVTCKLSNRKAVACASSCAGTPISAAIVLAAAAAVGLSVVVAAAAA